MHNSSPGSVNIASSERGPVDRSSTFEDEEIDIVEEEEYEEASRYIHFQTDSLRAIVEALDGTLDGHPCGHSKEAHQA